MLADIGAIYWKKVDLHDDDTIRMLSAQYGHCTVKQKGENVLNNVLKITNGLRVFAGHPSYCHQN
jgi:hypothetical protein